MSDEFRTLIVFRNPRWDFLVSLLHTKKSQIEPGKEFSQFVLIEKRGESYTAVVCDGYCVHVVESVRGVEDGLWRLVSKGSYTYSFTCDPLETKDIGFPDWEKHLVLHKDATRVCVFDVARVGHDKKQVFSAALSGLFRAFPEQTNINIEFLRRLSGGEWAVYWSHQVNPVAFYGWGEYKGCIAVLSSFILRHGRGVSFLLAYNQ